MTSVITAKAGMMMVRGRSGKEIQRKIIVEPVNKHQIFLQIYSNNAKEPFINENRSEKMITSVDRKIVKIGNVLMGGGNPIVVQSMTNTSTADIAATTAQIIELNEAGSEVVRITVNDEESAKAVPQIKENLIKLGYGEVPIVGDFHYNGHKLLNDYPEMAMALDKYRINPGNVGFKDKRDTQFEQMIKAAIKYDRSVRIGVNWGSLDQDLATSMMDENKKKANPLSASDILQEALIRSALSSAEFAKQIGLAADKIVISCKVSKVQELVSVYQELAKRCDYPLHLGLTEAGMGSKGLIASTAALAILLQQGIGDTIRVSITPEPGEARTKEVEACQEILQTMGIRKFKPLVTACPGCGRTTSTFFQKLTKEVQDFITKEMPRWRKEYPKAVDLDIAVMGCIVNGPGESKHANIGISLPGTGESPAAPVFIDGQKVTTLRGENIAEEFKEIVRNYIMSS